MLTELEIEDIKFVALLNYNWSKLKNKTLFISGGTGFIGQFIINVINYRNRNFNDNITVVCISRHPLKSEKNIIYLKGDVAEKIETDYKFDYVLHLASNTHPKQYSTDPIGTITTNVIGCKNMLDIAVKNRASFVLASSVEIYGEGNGKAMDEAYCGYIDCNTVRAGYNEAKRVSESLCQAYSAQYGLNCYIARFSRCFGADRKDDSKAIAQFIRSALKGERIVLKSKGEQRYSYCYVVDAVSGLFKILLEGQAGEAYNIAADDDGKTLGDYAQLIAEYAQTRITFDLNSKNEGASKANYAIIDCTKLKKLGWKPLFTVTDALKRTIDILK